MVLIFIRMSCTGQSEQMNRLYSHPQTCSNNYSLTALLHLTKNILLMLLPMLPRREKSGYGSAFAKSDHLLLEGLCWERLRPRRRTESVLDVHL